MDIQEAIDDEYTATANLGRTEIPEQMKPYIIELLTLRKELQQYRQIGTVDECRAAMEKQIPQKPEIMEVKSKRCCGDSIRTSKEICHGYAYKCPKCGFVLRVKTDCYSEDEPTVTFCSDCGQALKWGD